MIYHEVDISNQEHLRHLNPFLRNNYCFMLKNIPLNLS